MSFERFDPGTAAWNAEETGDMALPEPPEALDPVRSEVDCLDQFRRPDGFSETRWYTLLRDARDFTERWLDIALGCGWTLPDLFGFREGVVFFLDGREVMSIDDNRIIIGNTNGTSNAFYRHSPGVSVPFDRSRVDLVWDALRLAKAGTEL